MNKLYWQIRDIEKAIQALSEDTTSDPDIKKIIMDEFTGRLRQLEQSTLSANTHTTREY